MAIRNQSWYNLNSTRDYPLADAVTATSDGNQRLPQDIVVDLRIRWPDILGKYAFLGSVAVTKGAVTATILASTDPGNSSASYTPIGVITVPLNDLDVNRQYALEPMYPAVFGYITFGSGVTEEWTGNFSAPTQSLLTARSARPYAALPVSSLARLYDATPLTGVIKLRAESPMEIVKATRTIGGIERECAVIRLRTDTTSSTLTTENPFEVFAGDCGKRPESLNCGDPKPVQTINAVTPDCDGVICLNFKGCSVIGKNVDDCGVVVDCGIGLSETCDPPMIPTLAGVLPSEVLPSMPPVPPTPEPDPTPDESFVDEVITDITLPHCDGFLDETASGFSVTSGSFVFREENSPDKLCTVPYTPPHWDVQDSCSESCSTWDPGEAANNGYSYCTQGTWSGGQRNISLFTSDEQTIYRKYETDVRLIPGTAGEKHNGGIILNYKSAGGTFYLLEIDWDDGEFRFSYYNGFTFNVLASHPVPALSLNAWYHLELSVVPTPSLTYLDVVAKLESSSLNITMTALVSSNSYGTDSELSGFHANRAAAQFSYWRIEEKTSL
jgi:hypothetical protein